MFHNNTDRKSTWAACGCSAILVWSAAADASEATPWSVSLHSAARLIDAGPAPSGGPGARLAGAQIRLDPRYLTYWRSPGEAGLPPSFDFEGSGNLASAVVSYPAPQALAEGGTKAFGYTGRVTFPLAVVPRDPSRPVELVMRVDYGVCADLCLPAQAHLRLELAGDVGSDAAAVRDALHDVPRHRRIGEGGAVRIEAVRGALSGPAAGVSVEAAVPDGVGTLFVEAPEGWYLEAGPGIARGGDRVSYDVKVLEHPSDNSLPSEPLRLTLVSPGGAIEVAVPLDRLEPRP